VPTDRRIPSNRKSPIKPRPQVGKVRLERALSKLGIASRTQAREAILGGRVSVDGKVARNPDAWVVPEKIRIAIDGKGTDAFSWRCFLLHKPNGVVTTRADDRGRKTVFDVLPTALRQSLKGTELHAVGRLDLATTGLLLLTNDTKLSNYLTDPTNAIPRTYVVTARGEVTPAEVLRMESGVIDDGELLRADRVRILKASGKESNVEVVLLEGKNREVRRLLASQGHEVTRLKRIEFGGLKLGHLAIGAVREVPLEEIRKRFPDAPLRVSDEIVPTGFPTKF
jgi:23S rRNA pseudouridine2605 synthase